MVGFIVEADGTITEPKILTSVSPALDAEALRVVKNMPRWIPGKNNGSAVRMQFSLPITFRMQ